MKRDDTGHAKYKEFVTALLDALRLRKEAQKLSK